MLYTGSDLHKSCSYITTMNDVDLQKGSCLTETPQNGISKAPRINDRPQAQVPVSREELS